MAMRGRLLSQFLLLSCLMFLAAAVSPAQEAPEAELLARAQQKLEACDFEGVIADCGEALRRDPANGEALYLRARARLWNGDRPGATEDCATLLASDVAGDARSCFRRGCAREMTRDIRTALAEFTRAISLAPADVEAYMGRLRVLTRQSDYRAMASDADTVIALTTETIDAGAADGRAYRSRGHARNLRGQTEDASADFVKALELNPRDVWALLGLARTKQVLSDTEGALNDASQAVSLARRLAEAYVQRGRIRGGVDDIDGAILDMTSAIELDPEELAGHALRAQAFLLRGDTTAGLGDVEKLLVLDPKDADGYVLRGQLKAAEGDDEGAHEDFIKAVKLAENNFEQYNRAAQHVKGAYNDKMIALATEALALNPQNDVAYDSRAQAKARTKDLPGAIADMDQAIAVQPDRPQYYYVRGGYRKLTGDDAGAQADLDKARQLVPDAGFPPYPEPPAIPVAVMGFAAFLSSACFLIMGAFTVMALISIAKKRRDVGQWQLTQQQLAQLPVTVACETDVRNARDVKRVALIVGPIGVALSSLNGIVYLAGLYGQTDFPWEFPPANPVVLALLAGVCYLTGIRAEGAIRRLVITPDDVTLITPRKQGDEKWTEPLANYRGLLGKTGVYSRKGNDNEEHYMEMELLHDDPDRTIRVYRKKGSMESVPKNERMTGRGLWKTYAGLLGVDALEQHERDIVVHEVEDLGKSARELVREGKLDAPLDPAGPVPQGITIRADNGETIVTVEPGNNFDLKVMRGVGIALGIYLWLNLILSGVHSRSGLFALVGAAMIFYAIWYKQPHTRLRITRDSLRVQSVTPRRETTVATVDTASIEDVRLETIAAMQLSLEDAFAKLNKKPGAPPAIRKAAYLSLITETKTVVVPAGRGKLPLETAEWLRSFILRMIAADQPPQPADHSEAML